MSARSEPADEHRGAEPARAVKSADRTLDVLEELAQSSRARSLVDLSRTLGIPKSSLHGLLRTLQRRGWVEADATGLRFGLGVRAMQVAGSYLDHDRVLAVTREVMDLIVADVGETVQLARLDGDEIVYLAQRQARHPVRLISSIGQRLPAHATALGKVLLSGLDTGELDRRLRFPLTALTENTITERDALYAELRRTALRGYAVDEQEASLGLYCFAAAVPSLRSDPPTDAISVSVPSFRLSDELRRQVIELLRERVGRLGHG
jgi:DNA-binding IclR family transcriptional regulator